MRQRFSRVVLIFLISLPAASAQRNEQQITLQILVDRNPLKNKEQKDFQFDVLAPEKTLAGESLTLAVSSIQGLEIQPDKTTQTSRTSSGIIYHFTATLPRGYLNIAELRADLLVQSQGSGIASVKQATYVVDLDFMDHNPQLLWSIPQDEMLTSGNPKKNFFRLRNENASKDVAPTATVQLELSSDDCAEFRPLPPDPSKPFGPRLAVNIEKDHIASPEFEMRTSTWISKSCQVWVEMSVPVAYWIQRLPKSFQVKPNPMPSLAMAILGAFINYVLGGLVQLVVFVRKRDALQNKKVNVFKNIFLGPYFVEFIAMLIKGVLAFGAAFLIQDTKLFGIAIDKDSLFGFVSLGFMFGFWPVERIWMLFQEAGPKSPKSADGPDDSAVKSAAVLPSAVPNPSE